MKIRKTKRPKYHAVRANKYGQAGLEPRHSDITPANQDATPSWREKKKMAQNEEGGKQ